MDEHVRDAAFAVASAVVLLALLARLDSLAVLSDPSAAAVGVAAALGIEALFVTETPAARLWTHRAIRAIAVGGFLLGVAMLGFVMGPWILAVACWGLATYFVLLTLVLTGVWETR